MQQRQLGQAGPRISAIGLGCWNFAGPYGPTSEKESHETLAAARDLGIDLLDTANVYGMGVSEKIIGSYLRDHPGHFRIATKAGIRRDPATGDRWFDNSADHLRSELEASLTRLGVEHVDLFYVHRREADRPIEEVVETLLRFQQEGKIGGFGFSEISPASLRLAHAVSPVAAVQSEYSLWTRQPDLGMVQACKELEVAFVAFCPLGRGIFAVKAPEPATFGNQDFRKSNPRFLEPNLSRNLAAIAPFKDYARDIGATPASLAIAWVLARGPHVIPIPGTRSADHLTDCVNGAALEITSANLSEIDRILPAGFAHGNRYSAAQISGVESYC
ncbi:putative oxidoreductase, aryl-alcohol dehydrogenase like protein [Hoeflea sp. IMCC20628]|uniref:aldo/keto reductase n=1 Tax=Hoeflea sp. IMCC20628 TaxID=1620421 RepID=UPI00063AAA8C|nr:aldo/keto reductase [Hoeflea sp. IMCC20628]AKH98941.1 putative oxidoreductase, aryl-alcohol dehydrogenase like protein [Hoeflea sp. IMCC20628]